MKGENNFRNQASRRFYEFFRKKIDAGELAHQDLADAFGVYQNNPRNFLNNLKSGAAVVTSDHIAIARAQFGLKVDELFSDETPATASNLLQEESVAIDRTGSLIVYDNKGEVAMASRLGNTLKQVFHKHKVSIDPYCRETLNMSRQFLYQMFRGESKIPLEVAVQVCDDLGESLDVFRTTPLPFGHIQTELELTKMRLEECLKSKKK